MGQVQSVDEKRRFPDRGDCELAQGLRSFDGNGEQASIRLARCQDLKFGSCVSTHHGFQGVAGTGRRRCATFHDLQRVAKKRLARLSL